LRAGAPCPARNADDGADPLLIKRPIAVQ
jgi:hypothetical protein